MEQEISSDTEVQQVVDASEQAGHGDGQKIAGKPALSDRLEQRKIRNIEARWLTYLED